ncbi:MAG: metallophosphoesterase family protein [Bryobacteraceae bacterium]
MRILIVSDLHANLEALTVIREECDELWVLGDLVDYGAEPAAVIDIVRQRASLVVRGNHDHAVAFDADPRCSPAFREMAEQTRQYTIAVLDEERKRYLCELPLTAVREIAGVRFHLSHALPSEPLYPYCGPDSERWEREIARIQADIVLTGHTHLPFARHLGGRWVVNPGSVGQPKHGRPEACYAVWEDGRIELRSVNYDLEAAVARVRALPVDERVREQLARVLREGRAASEAGSGRMI